MAIRDQELELLFFNDQQIRPYYKQYFGEDRSTDVIAFPLDSDSHLGCIVISIETAKRQAREHRHSLWEETRHLMVHGFLHLLGHDHAETKEARAMKTKETELLKKTRAIGR